ncbi:hypothetical protein AK812_SmicGene2936 [Symbiodinium microadriaticum]|uniref:Uncharacterized protein n=1 Tax=Symbiodinium microadriaticum TaxID=2951 RepID=A0A1Q9F0C6_SYMMI|nr:hypothetical protein AK812_SmicGene2936 [Symbiodinium microadriaticum]
MIWLGGVAIQSDPDAAHWYPQTMDQEAALQAPDRNLWVLSAQGPKGSTEVHEPGTHLLDPAGAIETAVMVPEAGVKPVIFKASALREHVGQSWGDTWLGTMALSPAANPSAVIYSFEPVQDLKLLQVWGTQPNGLDNWNGTLEDVELRDADGVFSEIRRDHVRWHVLAQTFELKTQTCEGCEYEVLQRLADTGWLKKIPRMVRLPSDRFTREMGGAGTSVVLWTTGFGNRIGPVGELLSLDMVIRALLSGGAGFGRCAASERLIRSVVIAFLCLSRSFLGISYISVHFRRHTRTMEEAPAMNAQQTSAEQPTEAALPAAETAAETPSPIAAPPGVPMKAPPPSLLAKEEPKEPAPTPEIGQLITLTDDLQVVRFTNGTIHLKRAGKEPEAITPSMFDALLQSIRTQANASAPSAMSGFTGLASTNRGSAPGTDNDPIEWGDMDPNFRQALQDSPELLKAYNTVRNPKKVAKLDPATNSFTPTTNIELPPPSVETPPPQVTMENLSTVLATYHEQTVQPSLDLLSNHIRQDVISRLDKQGSVIRYEGLALQSLEADAIRRTVLIHGLPPFTTKSQIDHNLHYLLQQAQLTESDIQTTSNHVNTSTNAFLKITFLQESTSKHFFQTFKQKKRWYHSNEAEDAPLRIERDVPMLERIERAPLHAVIDSLTKPQPPAMDEYLRCDFNSLQVWDNAEESLLAQVLYLPDKNLSYACYLLVVPRFFEEVREHFPRFFGDKLSSTIQFMQAYAAASRHATTALRYHFSQTKDVSNISREDAIRSFPYPIYPIELHDELSTQLSKNPNFILQGFLGMQTQIQQAVSDLGINLEDYGRKGKGTARNKGKGKGKRSDRKGYQSDMYRNPAEEEEDTDEDYKARDFDDYDPRFDELVQDSTRRRREDDRQQALRMYYVRLYGGDNAEHMTWYGP